MRRTEYNKGITMEKSWSLKNRTLSDIKRFRMEHCHENIHMNPCTIVQKPSIKTAKARFDSLTP